jgi:hypothetical protein
VVSSSFAPLALAGLAVAVALGPLTCLEGEDPGDPVFQRARALWVDDCAGCHGLTGNADGARTKELGVAVPSFREPCRKITDEWIERVILSGGSSYGGSEEMRSYHELKHDPEVLRKLVAFVQALRQEGPCEEEADAPPVEVPP